MLLSLAGSSEGERRFLKHAKEFLAEKPLSVVDKKEVAKSGDIHDFYSVSPYYWPSPNSKDGIPYIKKDGEQNPDANAMGDHHALEETGKRVDILANAYSVSKDEAFAVKTAELLSTWLLNPKTRMNPNFTYAQVIRGKENLVNSAGIIEGRALLEMLFASQLIQNSPAWNHDQEKGLHDWYKGYLNWLLTSPQGKKEDERKNNHGTWYDVQVVATAIYTGDLSTAKKVLNAAGEKRIARQITPKGEQPFELARTRSWTYSVMNLRGLMELATLGEKLDIDLWHFKGSHGESIRGALDYLSQYASGQKKWDHQEILKFAPERLAPLLLAAYERYKDETLKQLAEKLMQDERLQEVFRIRLGKLVP